MKEEEKLIQFDILETKRIVRKEKKNDLSINHGVFLYRMLCGIKNQPV